MRDFDVIDRIIILCKAYSWSYYRLAKESNITYSTLSSMINKRTVPSVPTIIKICDAFEISLSQFFSDDEVVATLSENEKEYLLLWKKLSDENKTLAKRFLSFLSNENDNGIIDKNE